MSSRLTIIHDPADVSGAMAHRAVRAMLADLTSRPTANPTDQLSGVLSGVVGGTIAFIVDLSDKRDPEDTRQLMHALVDEFVDQIAHRGAGARVQ